MFTVLGWMYRRYFYVSVEGTANVPARGRAMLVGNHSGGWAVDALMVLVSMFYELDPPRLAQGMAERFLNQVPFASMYSSKTGNFTGLPENAAHLLEDERLLMVFPEGARGTAKLYRERNTLVKFGTGFVRLAMQTKTPIVPFAFVGGGEAIPTIANLYRVGKLFGMPYLPVTKYLLPIPRPVPLQIYYGEPIVFDGTGTEDDDVINRNVEQVKMSISALLDRGVERRSARKELRG